MFTPQPYAYATPDATATDAASMWFSRWLLLMLALVVLMVGVGGLTRLTGSGLSIVEWKLLSGIFPPMSEAGWERAFAAYRTSPEFQKKNFTMDLDGFQQIYWLEYVHRLLGRIIGLVAALPLLAHLASRRLNRSELRFSGLLFALVCLQGLAGWYMVKSGLVDVPWVSPYRLAFHFALANGIIGALYWRYRRTRPVNHARALRHSCRHGWVVLAVLGVQLVLGAFVAGLDAGYTYNTYPRMDGQWIPQNMWLLTPWPRNMAEHIPTVQFLHRWWAVLLLVMLAGQWWHSGRSQAGQVLAVALGQWALGVATLLSVVALPLASLHQMLALLLLVMQLRYIYAESYARQAHPT